MIPEQTRMSLIERINPEARHKDDCYRQINRACEIANSLDQTRAKLTLDKDLSDIGRQKKMLESMKAAAVELYEATKGHRAAMSRVVGQRKTFVPKTPDRTDAVGELRRQEMRAYFRKMRAPERQIAAAEVELDDVALDAILDAPPALSGFNGGLKADYDRLKKVYAERHYGDQARQIDAIEEDYGNVGAAFDIAKMELKKAVPMHDHAFNEIMEQARKSVDERYV